MHVSEVIQHTLVFHMTATTWQIQYQRFVYGDALLAVVFLGHYRPSATVEQSKQVHEHLRAVRLNKCMYDYLSPGFKDKA